MISNLSSGHHHEDSVIIDLEGFLTRNTLFSEVKPSEIKTIIVCLAGRVLPFKKGEYVLSLGDAVTKIGIVLSGNLHIIKEDFDGNVNIIASIGSCEVFAEALAFSGVKESPVDVQASEDSEVLLIEYEKIIKQCSNNCTFHSKLIENMLKLLADKNILLNQKIEIMSKRTTREKLLAYFGFQKQMTKSNKVIIPFNREALAQYLCVDRSALSRELCSMRDDGLISFKKNEFEII